MSGDQLHSLNNGVFVLPRKRRRIGERPQLGPVESETYASLESAYQYVEKSRSLEQVKEVSEWLLGCSEKPWMGHEHDRLPVALVQNLSVSVQRELSEVIDHVVTVDCHGTGDIGGLTKAIAVGIMGEAAAESQRVGLTPIEAVCAWWKRSSEGSPLLLHLQNPQTILGTAMSDLVHVLNLHCDAPFRLLLSVPSIKTFLSTWAITDSSGVDLHVLSGGRARKGCSSLEDVLRAGRNTAFHFSRDFDERIRYEENIVGGGAAAVLKTMRWLLLQSRHNNSLRSYQFEDSAKLQAALATEGDSLEPGSEDVLDKLTSVNFTDDAFNTQNPAPRLATLHALGESSAFLSGTADAAWNVHLTDQTRSHPHRGAGLRGGSASEAFPEVQALYNLWQGSGKSINLWDWLDSFRQAVVFGGAELVEDEQAPTIDEETDSRLHSLFIRFVEEARLFGTVRARGKNTTKRGDEVVKGVIMP